MSQFTITFFLAQHCKILQTRIFAFKPIYIYSQVLTIIIDASQAIKNTIKKIYLILFWWLPGFGRAQTEKRIGCVWACHSWRRIRGRRSTIKKEENMYTVRKILSIVWKLGMYVEDFDSYLSAYIDGCIETFFDSIQFLMILKSGICN